MQSSEARANMPGALSAVFVGGLLGTALRLGLDAALPHGDYGFPVSTLAINVLGSFVLGYLVTRLWSAAPEWARAGLGAGLLGSFTTFSAVSVSLVTMTQASEWGLALAYLAATVIAGLGAAWAGLALGARRPSSARPEDAR